MAAPTRPNGVGSFGKENFWFAPASANPAAPTVAEITAVTGLELTGRMYVEGGGEFSQNVARGTAPRRVADTQIYERAGEVTVSITDLHISLDPQAAAGSEAKAAYEELTDGVTGYLIRRQGLDRNTDLEAGQFVDVIPVEFKKGIPTKTGNDAFGEFSALVPTSITGEVNWNVAVAA